MALIKAGLDIGDESRLFERGLDIWRHTLSSIQLPLKWMDHVNDFGGQTNFGCWPYFCPQFTFFRASVHTALNLACVSLAFPQAVPSLIWLQQLFLKDTKLLLFSIPAPCFCFSIYLDLQLSFPLKVSFMEQEASAVSLLLYPQHQNRACTGTRLGTHYLLKGDWMDRFPKDVPELPGMSQAGLSPPW